MLTPELADSEQECEQYADASRDQRERTQWLCLAEDWLKLAADFDHVADQRTQRNLDEAEPH
jgi:hypothetical protein